MATEFDLRQAAIDLLHGMLRGKRELSKAHGELAIDVLAEMREAREERKPPEWVQQLMIETALENERERRERGKE